MLTTPEFAAAFPIEKLTPHPRNARRGNVDMIAMSLDEHGQYKPLVVQRMSDDGTPFVVCAGNHTLLAARQLEWTTADVMLLDIDDDEAARILLIDNRANDVSDYDDQALASLLEQLTASERGLAGSGYEDHDLHDLLDSLTPPTLDELADDYGEHEPSDLWPVLRFKVSPQTRDRYRRLVENVPGGDADQFEHMLTLAEQR